MIITITNTSEKLDKLVDTAYPDSLKNLSYSNRIDIRNWHATEDIYVVKNRTATIGDGIYIPAGFAEEFTKQEFEQARVISTGNNDKVDIAVKEVGHNNF